MLAAHDIAAVLPYAFAAAIALVVSLLAKLNSMGLFSAPLALASPSSPSSSSRHAPRPKPAHDPGDRYPGMVNLSGTLCYMNSVLQAFASLPTLTAYLGRVIRAAESVDLPTPVSDALYDVLADLNTGHARHPAALRPHVLLAALSPLPQIRRLLATREQQDAHELYVVLAEAVSDEAAKVAKEVARVRGGLSVALELRPNSLPASASTSRATTPLPSAAPSIPPRPYPPPRRNDALLVPWEGLLARRRICARCGYSDVVRMDTLGGMELSVPRSGHVTLDECISEYLAPERLSDVTCDMCTTRATAAKYAERAQRLEGKKSRAHAAKVAARLRAMVDAGVVGTEGGAPKDVKWDVVRTDCVRETAVTRAPATLRFHFVRSEYTPYGQLLKKTARVAYPLMFDLGPHMARGVWEPKAVVGGVAAALAAGGGASSREIGEAPRALYRLQSAILHKGYAHSSGHFVAIRRKPGGAAGVPGRGWLRISDADVDEVGTEELAATAEQVVMLFYERVDLGQGSERAESSERESDSEERMELAPLKANGGDVDDVADADEDRDGAQTRPERYLDMPSFAGLGTPLVGLGPMSVGIHMRK
ncbi:cysteine proteinase [Cutaneotrichosporon oleaginosum]|uniref:ubiquitinyl hydrolase 1 n=1 Tax=Cutaneotrichosporon oleaginosum TaxID=879819 RepID=A0A0J0XJY6_9TREE|nr:cysteine proteinase [Cutaneotrichosporon oleaginosum]KLT41391.1 cysteine proteinase [Cutaneotrichosporon oleaginosum]TXT06332.1 hypothetical protein COLE_05663 [Cutaneotrichosporon oleaginosum]